MYDALTVKAIANKIRKVKEQKLKEWKQGEKRKCSVPRLCSTLT